MRPVQPRRELVPSRSAHPSRHSLWLMTSWRDLAAWHRSATDYCCERWSIFAPLSCGTLAALAAGSALATEDWAQQPFSVGGPPFSSSLASATSSPPTANGHRNVAGAEQNGQERTPAEAAPPTPPCEGDRTTHIAGSGSVGVRLGQFFVCRTKRRRVLAAILDVVIHLTISKDQPPGGDRRPRSTALMDLVPTDAGGAP